MTRRRLHLRFHQPLEERLRKRLQYAFQVFASVYGYEVVDADAGDGTQVCVYGAEGKNAKVGETFIPARYCARESGTPAPAPICHSLAGEDVYLFHGLSDSGNPDWLGEIFEWLTCPDESSSSQYDSIGRVSYAASVFAKRQISPSRPYASILMASLEGVLCGGSHLLPASSPITGVKHLVISSHDIDFYFSGITSAATRVIKNLAIALTVARSRSFFHDSLRQLARCLRGERIGDYLPEVLRCSKEAGIRSTLFVIAASTHRRDANYGLQDIRHRLKTMREAGFEIALHGSYKSVVENCDLQTEACILAEEAGEKPLGSRQHWLRFDSPQKLSFCIEQAGLRYDSSWGWSDQVGFRNGAAFAFPPYNFEREEPCDFLLIPLVVMDCALQQLHSVDPDLAQKAAEKILQESRRFGWGGISILWHNPVEPLSVCHEVNQIFWQQANRKEQYGECWISAREFINLALPRYQQAGLLKKPIVPPIAAAPQGGSFNASGRLTTPFRQEHLSASAQ
jgi:hypothetical protein